MPRFVPVASPNPSAPMAQGRGRFTPVTGGQRFTPVSQPMQPGSSTPLGTPLSNQLLGGLSPTLGKLGGGIGAAAGIGSGIYDLTQGGSGQDLAFGMASLANPAFG